MSERAPGPEKKYNEMVPEYMLDKELLGANFTIPAHKEIRDELRRKLEGYSHYGAMHLSENKKAKAVLLAQIAAIEAYDAEISKTLI
ncbi:hypothetical protein A3A38_01835 [Candidatus Kaiserbacteria bacterium RIFCSPLOWO2_01_FULL_53_17]|uniref:Uncharacterized protein n=1 Tax=Candidatus Kaiserbacteria bacterium RIFCSPLOWO2_01_FULL_53_17 TaxID=1798511 RepID=A0A1F6EHF1_9BACT|nr:MAG: hypothetical protein A3A38_01835 [Candidatus Kaiserbacteria bacterium RIFCSPLOWO2_01_FULL_53_17]